ncbi:hypothetical protein GW17_00023717 [Ensete ventricosum]|nr:hypothetical protein GW17_00023717 [Ensete ventricosum]RZR80734.1 hypothetical protein BHM03_00006809 [Ensete ventricosum]
MPLGGRPCRRSLLQGPWLRAIAFYRQPPGKSPSLAGRQFTRRRCIRYKNAFSIPIYTARTGLPGYRYADRLQSGDTAKIDRRRSIEGEIDCRRSMEGEKGKKKKRKRRKRKRRKKKEERRKKKEEENKKVYLVPSSPTCCCHSRIACTLLSPLPAGRPRAVIALALARDFSPARGERLSARGTGSPSSSPSIDCRRPKLTVDGRFWLYRLVAGGPHTGQLADRYVSTGTGPYRRVRQPLVQSV